MAIFGSMFGGGRQAAPPPDYSQLPEDERRLAEALLQLEKTPTDARVPAAEEVEKPLEERTGLDWWKGFAGKAIGETAMLPVNLVQLAGRGVVEAGKGAYIALTNPRLAADLLGQGIEATPEAIANVGRTLLDEYTELATNPKAALSKRPLQHLMDLSIVGGMAGKGISGAARLGAEAGLLAETSVKTIDKMAKMAKYIDPIQLTMKGAEKVAKLPGIRNVVEGVVEHAPLIGRRSMITKRVVTPKMKDITKAIEGATEEDVSRARMAAQGETGIQGFEAGVKKVADDAAAETEKFINSQKAILKKWEGKKIPDKGDIADRIKQARAAVDGSEKLIATARREATDSFIGKHKGKFVRYADLTPKQKQIFDAMKRTSAAITEEGVSSGIGRGVYSDAPYKTFAANIGLVDAPHLADASVIKQSKQIASELGLDIEFFPHQFTVGQSRREFYEAIGKDLPEYAEKAAPSGVMPTHKIKTRTGAEGYLGSESSIAAREADKVLADEAIKNADIKLASGLSEVEAARQIRIKEAAGSFLDSELALRTGEFDVAHAYQRHIERHANFVALVDYLDGIGRKYGRKFVWGDPAFDSRKEAILDVDSLTSSGESMFKGSEAGFKGLSKGYSVEESGLEAANATVENVIKERMRIGETGVQRELNRVYVIPKRWARAIQDDLRKYSGNTFVGAVDSVHNLMRTTVLGLSPRWHVNNVVGNFLLSVLEVRNPASYIRAFMKQFKDVVHDELFQKSMMEEAGAKAMLRNAQKAAEMARGPWYAKILKKVWGKTAGFAEKSGQLNALVDNYFRRVLYLDKAVPLAKSRMMKRFGAEADAIAQAVKKIGIEEVDDLISKVNKVLPDYTALSPMERMYLRRIMPFYTFNRNMLQFGMMLPINHPVRTRIMAAMSGLWYDATTDPFVPPYMRATVPIGFTKEGNPIVWNISGVNPMSAFSGIMEGISRGNIRAPLEEFAQTASPLIEVMIESATGRESFSGRPFSGTFVTFGGKEVVRNAQGKLEEVTPGQTPLQFAGALGSALVPQAGVAAKLLMGEEPLSGVDRKTGKKREGEIGGQAGREALKLAGANIRVIDKEKQAEDQKLLAKQHATLLLKSILKDRYNDPEAIAQLLSILSRHTPAKRSKGRGAFGSFR